MTTIDADWNGVPDAMEGDPPRYVTSDSDAWEVSNGIPPLSHPTTPLPPASNAGVADERLSGALAADSAGSVSTLRAILWGGGTAPSSTEERLAAIERRLDALASHEAGAPRSTSGAAWDGEDRQARLERQLAELRLDHDQLAANATAAANELDQVCRLRQRRVRVANRLELQRLRRQVYAPAGAFALRSSLDNTAHVTPAPTAAEHMASHVALTADVAPRWPLPRHVEAISTSGPADQVVVRALAPDALDASSAWHTLGNALGDLARALWMLLVVLGRLAADDARASWDWIHHELFARERDDQVSE